jgi:hypothetical protein
MILMYVQAMMPNIVCHSVRARMVLNMVYVMLIPVLVTSMLVSLLMIDNGTQ